jgi:hypothetical protein
MLDRWDPQVCNTFNLQAEDCAGRRRHRRIIAMPLNTASLRQWPPTGHLVSDPQGSIGTVPVLFLDASMRVCGSRRDLYLCMAHKAVSMRQGDWFCTLYISTLCSSRLVIRLCQGLPMHQACERRNGGACFETLNPKRWSLS